MSNPQHEPTMEEILASIRKIISEDGPENPPAAEAPAPVLHDDVLELTHEVVEPAPPPPVPEPEPLIVPPPQPAAEHDLVFEPVETPPAPAPEPAMHEGIFSDHTRKAVDDAFAAIPDEPEEPAPAPAPAAPIAAVSGASVEAVFERAIRENFDPVLKSYLADNSTSVIEAMKPHIREWMDEHFPALLEGAVRAEVERVVKARGTKR